MASNTATKDDTKGSEKPAAQANGNNLPASQDQQPEKSVPAIVQIKTYIDARMGELAYALPPHISPERFQRVLLTALQRNHKLLQCTKQSLWNACLLAAQDGLLPDGREGAIVPYGENADGKKQADVATWMPMIEGLRKKARNSGEVLNWEVHLVRQRDHFEVILGDTPRLEHKPYFGSDEPGQITGAYSIAWLKDGVISRDVMTKRDLDMIRAKSKAKNGPWNDAAFEGEMYKKTVARRHYKQLPHSSDLDRIMQRDDEAFGLEDRSEAQIDNRQQKRVASTAAAFDQFAGNAGAPLIEHDAGQQGGQQADDEFGYDDQPEDQRAYDTKPGDDKGAAASQDDAKKSDPISSGPQDQQRAEDAKRGASVGEEVRRWPNGEVPKDADEYEHYVETKLSDFTKGDDISPWWKSKEENELRKACKVPNALYETLRNKAANRAADLRKAK